MPSDRFDDLARSLATASTRRQSLGVIAGGVAAFWGLLRSPAAMARATPCTASSECSHTHCCCAMPGRKTGVCRPHKNCGHKGGICL